MFSVKGDEREFSIVTLTGPSLKTEYRNPPDKFPLSG